MMRTRYLVRLDDACPTMSRAWERIESLLDVHGIKPMVAVIPDNRDPQFQVEPSRSDFWDIVRRWQSKGWTISMHGYQHVYETSDGGLVPINRKSEFAGLPFEVQREKIKSGWAVFRKHGFEPAWWVAPAHSFDEHTLRALRGETAIRAISDGIALRPFSYKGFSWVPQQLWKFKQFPFGIYTICLHPAMMSEADFARLERDLAAYSHQFVSFSDLPLSHRRKTLVDRIFSAVWWYIYEKRRNKKS